MKTNRILRVQLIALLIVIAISLASCTPREVGSNRSESLDILPVVIVAHITDNIARALYDQLVVQDREM
jgi:hypothetical protein